MQDVEFDYFRARGAGGQNVNKVESGVRATHSPTGIAVRVESERSQAQNKATALAALAAHLLRAQRSQQSSERAEQRRSMVGSGQRGDKVRTIRYQDGIVTCERTGKKHRLKDYLRGDLDWLF